MLRSLIAVFVVASAAAGPLFAEGPAVPPYGYRLDPQSCPKAVKGTISLWDALAEKSWDRMEKADKRTALDEYCQHGPELFTRFSNAKERMRGAIEEAVSLEQVKAADQATEKDIDFVCDHKIEGRNACKICCQELVTVHGELVELRAKLTAKKLKTKNDDIVKTGSLRDAERLKAAGITNEQMFENTGERKSRAGRDASSADQGKPALDEDAVKSAGLRDKRANAERYEKPKKQPPLPGMTERESAYIREAEDSIIPGLGRIKGNLAKEEIDGLHSYMRNCYGPNPGNTCWCKNKTDRELRDNSFGCDSEILKRKLGQ